MLDILTDKVIIAFAVFIGLAALLRHVMTRQPQVETDPEGETGHIAPNRALLAVICLVGVALAGASLLMFAHVGSKALLVVAAAALVMTGLMITAFFPFYDITWDEDGLEGPTLLLPPPFGPRRVRLYWEEIEKAHHESGRHWYLEDAKGNRILWSFIYFGYPTLMKRAEEECPWLFEQAEAERAFEQDPEAIPPVKRRFLKLGFASAKSA
jgi:uncharacterized membrane protein